MHTTFLVLERPKLIWLDGASVGSATSAAHQASPAPSESKPVVSVIGAWIAWPPQLSEVR